MYMDPWSQLILFFHYIFFESVDLKYYNTIQTFFSNITTMLKFPAYSDIYLHLHIPSIMAA